MKQIHFHKPVILARLPLFGLAMLSLIYWFAPPLPQVEAKESAVSIPASTAALCRFGVNATTNTMDNYDVTDLRLGWYLDYSARIDATQTNGIEYKPMVRLEQVRVNGERTDNYTYRPSGTALQAAIADNPGAVWIIGNEPDRIEVQDDMEPHVYAAAYHELYHLIKTADPTALIAAGTIVQPTPVRLIYLDMILTSYVDQFGTTMPVDAWNIHNFILNEVSCDYDPSNCWGADIPPGVDAGFGEVLTVDDNDNIVLFQERLVRFRQWMYSRGYGDKPLYLTEYGILMPEALGFPPERVNAFMNASFDYMLSATDPTLGYAADNYRLVQNWSWFSTHDLAFNGDLFEPEPPHNKTVMGENFANYTADILDEIDLFPWRLTSTHTTISESNPVTLTLQVSIANAGNLTVPSGPVLVRFYDGDPQIGGTQIGSDQFVTVAGCGRTDVATITLPNVSQGAQTVYVWVDPANNIGETDEANNIKGFPVLVAEPNIFLPMIQKPSPPSLGSN